MVLAKEQGLEKIIFVVTPLNILGTQEEESLNKAGIPTISVNKTNASNQTMQDIESGKYNIVIINPEILMGDDRMERLWKKTKFTSRIINFVFDEAHCISQWGKFRKHYLRVGDLRYMIPNHIPFHAASATLPTSTLESVVSILNLRKSETQYMFRSTDRPEISLFVRPLAYPANSFRDLDFLIPEGWKEGDPVLSSFVVFFDDTKETERAAKYLQKRLPESCRDKIRWFHATMTPEYRETELIAFKANKRVGECATDSFGMGIDKQGIKIVVQWLTTCNMKVLWQRFGRAARGENEQAVAILLVDKKDLASEREAKTKKAEDKKTRDSCISITSAAEKRKATSQLAPAAKRPALVPKNDNTVPVGSGSALTTVNHASVHTMEEQTTIAPGMPQNPTVGKSSTEMLMQFTLIDKQGLEESERGARGFTVYEGSALDCFINPAVGGYSCRRGSPTDYFSGQRKEGPDNRDGHLNCDPSNPEGCGRCRPRRKAPCCDLCHPAFFRPFFVATEKMTRGPNKTKVKSFEKEERDISLLDELLRWRQKQALEELGPFNLRTFGAKFIMADEVLDSIVYCSHVGKIKTADQLKKEIGDEIDDYVGDIFPLVERFYPPPPPNAPQETGPVARSRTFKCGACGQEGHRKTNSNCPMKKRSYPTPENQPPRRQP